jgi:hypothetical protein
MHIQNDHRTKEPDEKRASGNNATGSLRTNKTTLSWRVSTASDRITQAGRALTSHAVTKYADNDSDSDTTLSRLVTPRREKRPCGLPATFVTTCDAVPGYVTHVSYFSTRRGVVLCTYSPFFEGRKRVFASPLTGAQTRSLLEEGLRGQGISPLRQTPSASMPLQTRGRI